VINHSSKEYVKKDSSFVEGGKVGGGIAINRVKNLNF